MRRSILITLFCLVSASTVPAQDFDATLAEKRGVARLLETHGKSEEARIRTGVAQVARMWRESDGNTDEFVEFVSAHFLTDAEAMDATFSHLEYAFEVLDGHFVSMIRELRHYMDEDVGPIRPVDRLLAAYDPSAHMLEDLFQSRIAFVTLLNFTSTTLAERLEQGDAWTRRRWAESRLVGRFSDRVPADVQQELSRATSKADAYIAEYNLYLHRWLTDDGKRLFPEGLRLISHWGLRDELKSHYADPDGLTKQRMIARVMDHIVRQTIPKAVINNPKVDWKVLANEVAPTTAAVSEAPEAAYTTTDAGREADQRYAYLLDIFGAMRDIDPFTPDTQNAIQRAFSGQREIPVATVKELFEGMFKTPTAHRVADFIAERLGRDLEPFDIWYAGFKANVGFDESELDAITKKKYPTPAAFEADIPRILQDLGFADEAVRLLTAHITVDPSRGAGHAWGAQRRDDKAHLRTRVGPDGMDYKGYNIAVHELGHNVEQVFSLNRIDHTLLAGVPANAFTEALAFVFQDRDLELLGLSKPSEESKHLRALEAFWGACEIGAVALVDIAVWEWMYEHPESQPAELRQATIGIAEEVWARTFAPLMGGRQSALLGIYSHMLAYPLYLANYPLGHLIAFQLEEHFDGVHMAQEFERVCKLGRLTPDLWMRRAVGSPLSAESLISAADAAVGTLQRAAAGGDE